MALHDCVLVLGAGASHPYGFPCGDKFREKILEVCETAPLIDDERSLDALKAFRTQFSRSTLGSVDRFLKECQSRPSEGKIQNEAIIEMGKAAIAHAILPCEDPDSETRDWYADLLEALLKQRSAAHQEKLTIITFNYDRSLECHLLLAFAAIDGRMRLEAERLKSLVEIIHVYGQLGELPEWNESGNAVAYGQTQLIGDAIKGIRVIGERATEVRVTRIRERLKNAKALAFLGFGFLDENLEILALPQDRKIPIFVSAYNLGPGRTANLQMNYASHEWVFGAPTAKTREFLHDSDLFSAVTSTSPDAVFKLAYQLSGSKDRDDADRFRRPVAPWTSLRDEPGLK